MTLGFIADLHNHTTASDGEYMPAELVNHAASLGLQAVGVTDHDTLNGLDEALAAGEAAGIRVVPGVEVSLRFKRPYFTGTLHYLLYIPYDLLEDGASAARLRRSSARGAAAGWCGRAWRPSTPSSARPGRRRCSNARPDGRRDRSLADNVTRRHFALALANNHGLNKEQVNLLIGNDSRAYIPSGIDPATLTPLLHSYPATGARLRPPRGRLLSRREPLQRGAAAHRGRRDSDAGVPGRGRCWASTDWKCSTPATCGAPRADGGLGRAVRPDPDRRLRLPRPGQPAAGRGRRGRG
jgi:hypothetical protein